MDNISLSSGEEEETGKQGSSLAFREREKDQQPNEDTARFLL
jgi:hypothetical protein